MPTHENRMRSWWSNTRSTPRGAWWIAGAYMVIASAWIVLSDKLVEMFGNGAVEWVSRWQHVKGLGFVLVTGLLLGLAIRRRLVMIGRAAEGDRQAKDSAERANAAKDRFLAMLSHELRTPLTPVAATLQMWNRDPQVRTMLGSDLEMLRRNVELETHLIDDMLDLTRIVHGKLELHPAVIHVSDLLRSARDICLPDAKAKHIDIELSPHEGHLLYVHGDLPRLLQVLWNILKNAIKFTPAHGHIHLRCHADNHLIHISVEDNGIGIAPDLLERIFEPFSQGDAHVSRRFGGVGLGLAISRAVAVAHGGSLSASSPGPGHGATFTLQLHRSPAPAYSPPTFTSSPSPERHLRILLVEDHADTARTLARLISSMGHHVQVAESVAQALDSARQQAFDLLISDIGLPDGDGVELVRKIHDLQPIPAIALSGYGMDDDIQRSKSAGFTTHLTKPVNIDLLESTIAAIPSPVIAAPGDNHFDAVPTAKAGEMRG